MNDANNTVLVNCSSPSVALQVLHFQFARFLLLSALLLMLPVLRALASGRLELAPSTPSPVGVEVSWHTVPPVVVGIRAVGCMLVGKSVVVRSQSFHNLSPRNVRDAIYVHKLSQARKV
jgi:hypothetical protein